MAEPVFQIFECQNPECRLRFPSNLSVNQISRCPLCGSSMLPSGTPYTNQKSSSVPVSRSVRTVEVLLDNLRSTLNVGSIFRTAEGAGASHIYCCGTTPTPDHPKIVKTGLGAEWQVPWSYHRNALDVPALCDPASCIIALEAAARSTDFFSGIDHIQADARVLLILGSEISGIDPVLMERSQNVFSLPMLGRKTSLNVAVAAGIAIYLLRFHHE